MPMASASAQPMGTLSQMPVTPSRGRRQQVGQRHTGAERCDREHHRHLGLIDGPVVAVEQEQNADAEIARALNVQIVHTGSKDGGFRRVNEMPMSGAAKAHTSTLMTMQNAALHPPCTADALADAVGLARAVVLGHIGEKALPSPAPACRQRSRS